MAFIRERSRKDGTLYFSVVFLLDDGTQTSVSSDDRASAEQAKKIIEALGPQEALARWGIERNTRIDPAADGGPTMSRWLADYVDHLTGLDSGTLNKYRAYIRNDIEPILGPIPLARLTRTDIAAWVQWLQKFGAKRRDGTRGPASAKTIKNKHGFLFAALAVAVPTHLPANPAADHRLPQGGALEADEEMVFLSRDDFAVLLDATPEFWRPLVRFLALSGCRWGEASALRPTDVDPAAGTVRIRRAWTYSTGGYRLVKVKGKGTRTIDVPAQALDGLEFGGQWLFVNRDGAPVRSHGFHRRVWRPALLRAGLHPPPRIHDLRHTCASWLIQAGVPLPVVQRHLGHQSIKTTVDVYGHLDRTAMRSAVEALEAVVPKQKSGRGLS